VKLLEKLAGYILLSIRKLPPTSTSHCCIKDTIFIALLVQYALDKRTNNRHHREAVAGCRPTVVFRLGGRCLLRGSIILEGRCSFIKFDHVSI
jgi:hypothetical protein